MVVDFDGQFLLAWRQIGKAVTAAVNDSLSSEFGTGRKREFFSGRTEEDHGRPRRSDARRGPSDPDPNFTE